jgi:hypothetical protein
MIRGWNSIVGIVTRYRLDSPRIESWWGARFSTPVHTGPWAHPASYTMGTASFPGIKRPGHGVEVKERVGLCLYSPSGPSWPVLGWTLPLLLRLEVMISFVKYARTIPPLGSFWCWTRLYYIILYNVIKLYYTFSHISSEQMSDVWGTGTVSETLNVSPVIGK